MRHSIISVIVTGIVFGAALFFMPLLVLGIIFFLFIIRLLHVGCMGHRYYGHGYYGHGYRRGCDDGPGYGRGYDSDYGHGHCCEDDGYREHFHGHGPMHGHMFHWADKIRNMSEEEYAGFKNKMEKGFGYGFRGRNDGDYGKSNHESKSETGNNTESTEKKEETTK
jgi:hypothetical protein